MAENDIKDTTKTKAIRKPRTKKTSIANDNSTKTKTTKPKVATKSKSTVEKKPTKPKVVKKELKVEDKVFKFETYSKQSINSTETKKEEVIKDPNINKSLNIVKSEKVIIKDKKTVKLSSIYEQMYNAFINKSYNKGLFFIILKNILLSILISNFFYTKLNINSFSFYRMTFTDASIFSLKLFITLISTEIIYLLIVYLLNKHYGSNLNYKRIVSTFGSGLMYVSLFVLLSIIFINEVSLLGLFLLLVSLCLYLIVLITTVNIVSIDNNHNKLNITLISLIGMVLVLMIFFPLVSSQFSRIIEVMI